MHSVQRLFDLDEAVAWIKTNAFRCVALELPVYLLKYSVEISRYLNIHVNSQVNTDTNSDVTPDQPRTKFYTVVLNCCSVDYVSPRHLAGLADAVVRFGRCCLTSLPKGIVEYPVLFMFENDFLEPQSSQFIADYLKNELKQDADSMANVDTPVTAYTLANADTLMIADTNCLAPLLKAAGESLRNVSLAKFIKFTNKWTIPDRLKAYFVDEPLDKPSQTVGKPIDEPSQTVDEPVGEPPQPTSTRFYNYLLDRDLSQFKRLLFVGDRIPNSLKVLSLLEVVHLNPTDRTATRIATGKELMKRCSLIERAKKLEKFGVVFSHSYPDVSPLIDEIKQLAARRKKQINFITLVQTTDQFKLGNFPALESLVLVNSCYCSFLIDTISLHIPLISYAEFQIACGRRLEYGQVQWNEDFEDVDEQDSAEDAEESNNQLLLDDRNTALVESYFKADRWFGLQVNAGQDEIGDLKQGMKGIAMGYANAEGDAKK